MSSTKEIKANELVGNCKQIEQLAMDTNKGWLSTTITCPPIFHIKPRNKSNSWDGIVTPKDANKFQNTIWENTSRKLGKQGVYPFGFWVKEVNRSSAIHRHVLMYCDLEEIVEIKKWLNHYTKTAYNDLNSKFVEDKSIYFNWGYCTDLSEHGTEKVSNITNYLNKINLYYLKPKKHFSSLNKQRIDLDIVNKHNAHAEKYKYRRFGFFGLQKCLTLWKHLKYFAKSNTCKNISSPLKSLVDLAKNNELAKFIRSPLRNKLSLIYSSNDTYDVENKNVYGDKIKKIFGIKFNGKYYYTKERHFSLFKLLIIYVQLFILLSIRNIKI